MLTYFRFIRDNFLFISTLFWLPSSMLATTLISTAPGGDSTTGYQSALPAAFVDGEKIRGHMIFKNGITLGAGATVTWDSDGIVDGPITFNTGGTDATITTLNLTSDLRLGTTGSISFLRDSGGKSTISGNGNKIILGGDFIAGNSGSSGRSNLYVTSDLTIDGQGHTLTLLGSSNFRVSPGTTLTLKNINLDLSLVAGTNNYNCY